MTGLWKGGEDGEDGTRNDNKRARQAGNAIYNLQLTTYDLQLTTYDLQLTTTPRNLQILNFKS
jgi:hypothetical protein